jgi:hypothetical protein
MPQITHPPPKLAVKPPMPEALYKASTTAEIVRIPARTVLAIAGKGPPDGPAFQTAIQALYDAAYTLKFSFKPEHRDFRIGALEGRWWAEPKPARWLLAPRETWCWELRIGIPSGVRVDEVATAIRAAAVKNPEAAKVRGSRVLAQTAGRILHVGPYSDEERSLDAAGGALRAAGLEPAGAHLEVYLSDPRRVEPARLRTVLLLEAA